MIATRVPIRREQTKDRATQKLQQNAQASAAALNNFPLQPGKLVTGITVSVGPVITVIHGLGRVPKGWFAVRRYSYVSGNIGEVEVASSDTNTLSLGAVGAYTCDLWVF